MKSERKKSFFLSVLLAGISLLPAGRVTAQTFTTLHSFNDAGGTPRAALILSGSTLYGTAQYGGASDNGVVFKVNTDGTGFTILYGFTALNGNTNSDGANPIGGLCLSGSTLYGTTQYGGSTGNGTLFKVSTNGTGFTNFYSFTAGVAAYTNIFGNPVYTNSDGAEPYAGLILSGNTLYGTANRGGSSGNGTVFAVNTDGSGFTNLHSFKATSVVYVSFLRGTNSDGAYPAAGLFLSGNTLYGTAQNGGGSGNGTVFAVNIDGSGFTNLHSFTATSTADQDGTNGDGALPAAGLVLSGNALYGTAQEGGSSGNGTLFKVNTDGLGFTNLHNFTAPAPTYLTNSDGALPVAGLIVASNALYGTTSWGGSLGVGTVYRISTDGSGFTNVYSLNYNSVGGNPNAGLVLSGSTLYGTAATGGSTGFGTVFKVNTNGTSFSNLHTFTGSSDGGHPEAALTLAGNTLYGTALDGGSSHSGTLFKVNTDGSGFTNLYTFTGNNDGALPTAGLVVSGNMLYGTASYGGIPGYGTVFKVNTNGTGFTTLHSFSVISPQVTPGGTNPDGVRPAAGLILSGSTLYGTTPYGGMGGYGTVFKINTDGSGFATLHSFTGGNDGGEPLAGLIISGNMLYGTASQGGTGGDGTVFAINTNGTGFTNLHSFTGGPAASPQAGLVLSGAILYGAVGAGAVFKVNTDGTGFTNLNYVTGTNGFSLSGSLVLSGNTLYGTAVYGGCCGSGTVFAINTNGTEIVVLHSFSADGHDNSDGAGPAAGLILSGDTFYGTAVNGGSGGYGTVFSLSSVSFGPPLELITSALPGGTDGVAYNQTLVASGGQPPYGWTNNSGALPPGLTLSPNGMISGTPTTNGTFDFTVKVTDALSTAATQDLTIVTLDVTPPALTITAPTSGLRWSNAVFAVSGTATDNVAVTGVFYSLNNAGWSLATTPNHWTNWTETLSLTPGTNAVQAYATDPAGNKSLTNSIRLDFVVTNQLGVRAAGLGTISPNDSNAWLEVGRNYSLTATPATGFVATNWMISTNWIGGVKTNSPTVQFMMASNLTLQVTFADVSLPMLTITAPAAGKHMTNALATVVGTASDNWKVNEVWCQVTNGILPAGPWTLAATANNYTNWTTTLTLAAGTNTVKAFAVDLGGNHSTTSSVSVLSSNTFELQLKFTAAPPLTSTGLNFGLQLSPGLNGHIQTSTNLADWITLTNFVGTNSTLNFRDPGATHWNRRFYRAVVP